MNLGRILKGAGKSGGKALVSLALSIGIQLATDALTKRTSKREPDEVK